jgi:hypothetical protein
MIINRFFKVNSKEIVILKVNFKLEYEKFWVFVTFYKNLYTRLRRRSRAKKTLATAPAKSCCSTGSGSATLFVGSGSGIKDGQIRIRDTKNGRIRDKHPGSATLFMTCSLKLETARKE